MGTMLSDKIKIVPVASTVTVFQFDATCYFLVLRIGSACFEHYYAHDQELATMLLITTLVLSFLVCCMLEVSCS